MTIRTRLRFLIAALLGAAGLIMLFMFNAYTKIEADLVDSATANQISRNIFSLNILLHDFLATHEERPRQQWQNTYLELGSNIEHYDQSGANADEAQRLAQIRETYPLLQKLFSELARNYQDHPSAGVRAAEAILTQNLLLRSNVIVQAANQLSILSLQEIRVTKREAFARLAMAATSLLLIIALLFFTKRQIVASLRRLEAGAHAIGQDNFGHRVAISGNDEFSHLASAFNSMADHLGQTYQALASSNASLSKVLHDRSAKEQALSLMAQRLSMATKAADIGIWDWDIKADKIYWDANMYRLYGVSPTLEPLYQTWRERVHPEDIAETEAALLRTVAEKSQAERDFRIVTQQGEVRHIHSAEMVVLDAEGQSTNVIGINMDVTERKLTVDTLQRISALQRAILDSANFSIISTDTAGTIRVFNASAQRMLGYSEQEMVGQLTPAVLHAPEEVAARARVLSLELGDEIAPGFETLIAKARLGQVDENEWTYIRKDGSRFPVLLSVTALRDDTGTVYGFLGVGYDLTERKRLDRMQREFVSTVSHELRTPLTAIRGALGLIAGEVVGKLPPKAKDMTLIAMNNADRLVRLINDILDIEKIEAGKLQFHMQAVELSDLIQETVAANKAYALKYEIKVVVAASLPRIEVNGDRDRLIQVLTNLLSNACKFSPAGAEVRIDMAIQMNMVRISVKDAGHGIPENFKSQIFQKFCQADSSDTREKGGTGLGLNISRAIVEQHGGHIDFESTLQGGTCFWFSLPLKPLTTGSLVGTPA